VATIASEAKIALPALRSRDRRTFTKQRKIADFPELTRRAPNPAITIARSLGCAAQLDRPMVLLNDVV
jgi:hypothetical protein